MPYINKEIQATLDPIFSSTKPSNPGELNYIISIICLKYLQENLSYQRINDVIGALECAKLELTRRVVIPYENQKIQQNGDIL